MKRLFIFAALLYTAAASARQTNVPPVYPQTDFRQPLDLPPALAGDFGEIRGNHLHSGLDYRTNQREGYPVYAAADGYVSRLRVQVGGGGNIIYISHPNGYSTVYMHLQKFIPRIADYVKNYQYSKQQYDVDFAPLPGSLYVKKGELIAISGNTGATAGPHLHFEIRETKTEETINAQLFGIPVPDKVRPTVRSIYMYRMNGLPFSEYTPKQYFQVSGQGGNYRLSKSPVINVDGEVGFGLVGFDQILPGGNTIGIYSIRLTLDGQTIFESAMNRFAFSNSRGVNAHIDYPALLAQGLTIQKSFVEPGNPLTLYDRQAGKGLIDIRDDKIHDLTYFVKDFNGNTSTVAFKIKYAPGAKLAAQPPKGVKQFLYNQDNEYTSGNLRVLIPKGNLYSDLDFRYSVSPRTAGTWSAVHHLHTRLIPIHDNYTIWIRPDSDLNGSLFKKAVIVDGRGICQGGEVDNGWIKAQARYFGDFYLRLDTVAPKITPLTISDGRSMAGAARISLKISDNLSGIKSYNGFIDDKWVLMEFDQKTSTLFYKFDGAVGTGAHVFRLSVNDYQQNERIYTAKFFR